MADVYVPFHLYQVRICDGQRCQSRWLALDAVSGALDPARLVAVAGKFGETDAFVLLRLAVKGLLTYTEARRQLPQALPLVAAGGLWVPRLILSRFVETILKRIHRGRLKVGIAANLSQREKEVLTALMENLSNKEIASKLHISTRTIKFHVSSLLARFGVRRRADLILLNYQGRPLAA